MRAEGGKALSLWRDAGWGQLVAEGKYQDQYFSDKLVEACLGLLIDWNPSIQWVTAVPSLKQPNLVPDFAKRLAQALNRPYRPVLSKAKNNPQQKTMQNSFRQAQNLDGAFEITGRCFGRCLLVDDMVDSRWTFTVLAALLKQSGCEAVYPLALALNSPRMD